MHSLRKQGCCNGGGREGKEAGMNRRQMCQKLKGDKERLKSVKPNGLLRALW